MKVNHFISTCSINFHILKKITSWHKYSSKSHDSSLELAYLTDIFLVSILGRIQQLVRGFASDWKRSIENINQEIMRSFSNFKNGTAILQVLCV